MAQKRPSVGRIVHYVLEDGPNKGEHRWAPRLLQQAWAIIVRVWTERPPFTLQLQVFTDSDGPDGNDRLPNVVWKTSRVMGTEPGTWRWPEYAPPLEEDKT
jgi:hypothetical protein